MATTPVPARPSKNKWLAALLNLFLPGLGYLYVGRGKRTGLGVGLLIASVLTWIGGVGGGVSIPKGSGQGPLYAIGLLLLAIIFAWDAYKDAEEYSRGT